MHVLYALDACTPKRYGPLVTAVGIGVAAATVVIALIASYLRGTVPRRPPAAQAELERAAAQVDRELAADLELMSMFDQTKQAFVLENGQFALARETLAREVPAAYAALADVYERIPATEASMEKRGPAGSIPEADRRRIEEWEGDAREAQRILRASVRPSRVSRWGRLLRSS